jgi:hypothetical protein
MLAGSDAPHPVKNNAVSVEINAILTFFIFFFFPSLSAFV